MEKYHNLQNVHWQNNSLCFTLNNQFYKIDNIFQISERLANATDIEKNTFIVCPTGYGINWPLIDEDLSIDGLLNLKHKYKFTELTSV